MAGTWESCYGNLREGGIKEFFGSWQLFGKLDSCCFSTSWGMKYMEVYMASVYFIIRSPYQNQIVCGTSTFAIHTG